MLNYLFHILIRYNLISSTKFESLLSPHSPLDLLQLHTLLWRVLPEEITVPVFIAKSIKVVVHHRLSTESYPRKVAD